MPHAATDDVNFQLYSVETWNYLNSVKRLVTIILNSTTLVSYMFTSKYKSKFLMNFSTECKLEINYHLCCLKNCISIDTEQIKQVLRDSIIKLYIHIKNSIEKNTKLYFLYKLPLYFQHLRSFFIFWKQYYSGNERI